jgi:hypothetical protein
VRGAERGSSEAALRMVFRCSGVNVEVTRSQE